MNHAEAMSLLGRELDRLRAEPYAALAARIDGDELTYDLSGETGTTYQVEVLFLWDSEPAGNVRVIGFIDDGGWRAFSPLTSSFIKAPDDTLVGEAS
jgi:hypothetical protein